MSPSNARASLHAVVLAGGSGTRFWPASRESLPKQFLPIAGPRTMIAETVARLEGYVPLERVLVVTAADQAALARAALPDLPPENVVVEPEARNTAACVALAAEAVAARDPEGVQVVLAADHVIEPREAFLASLEAAVGEAAAEEVLVTFGIRPDHAATGYGYIELGERVHDRNGHAVHAVARFVEKPDRARAEEFLASGRFLWNSGMFVWSTRAIRAAFARHLPAVAAALARVAAGEDLARAYASMPRVPVDTGVLERAENVRVVPVDYRWSDVGSWAALPDVFPADAQRNVAVLSGDAQLLAEDAEGCVVHAGGDELVALLGVRDLVVVRAPGVTLVCPRDRAQDVRRIVARLAEERPSAR